MEIVTGLLFHENKVLVHRLVKDDFYALPGGRVEMFETTENTIVSLQQMKELLILMNRQDYSTN